MFQPRIEAKEESMKEREAKIKTTENERIDVEDRVFKDFCVKVGIKDIR